MHEPVLATAGRRRRVRVVVIAGLVVAVALVSVGAYGLTRSPSRTSTVENTGTTGRSNPVSTTPVSMGASPSQIAASRDPEEFARRVAAAVFAWDTSTGYSPSDYMQQVVDVGDPSGNETPGLATDLTDYLPDTAEWAHLRRYGTRQWLTIDTIAVPSSWVQALAQGTGTLLPGTTAYTITGIRHRAGVWDDKTVTTSGRVSFTVFETCQPTYPTCRLLRLSQPDNPLR